ncbi:Hint domain-containing protein [Phaeobacter inhibens]|uniref:Hint domain-containing protein n=1 Tax=Phaeobacter inhibens TaxID=221822 RepID=UPI0021A8FB74|nr:Hint domain-containing protein [Phaeobacter inhibens]UWR90344.1 Hint domain-containing protein [Phaeobacter inhibens]
MTGDALVWQWSDTDLLVSPRHRILLREWYAQSLLYTCEVLVAASYLFLRARCCRRYPVGDLAYFHWLLSNR